MNKLTVEEYRRAFVYENDGIDSWQITTKGDCDDFAISVAWIVSGHSLIRLWLNILFFRVRFYRVMANAPHAVLYYRGQYIDNIKPNWRGDVGFRKIFPWIYLPPVVFLKMLIGKVTK